MATKIKGSNVTSSTFIVPGNFQVDGTTTTINSTTLTVDDKNLVLASGAANAAAANGAGLTVDGASASLTYASSGDKFGFNKSLDITGTATATAFSGPLTGNVTGNVSGTAATVTTAAQTNITSLGTLTGLSVNGDTSVHGHASVGVNAVASSRALTVAGATDGSSSSIIVAYNSSLASKFAVRDDGLVTIAGNTTIGGDLAVDTNVLKVDSTNNKVGINVTSPDAMLQVQNGDITVGWADNFIGAQFQTGSDFRLGMKFGTVARTTKIVAETNDNNGEITFETNGSERARITNDGITFNGDTAAANALDDYEEGTWTPTIDNGANSVTYSLQVGRYTRIGNQVTFSLHIDVNTVGGTTGGQIQFGGLPFTAVNVASVWGGAFTTYTGGAFQKQNVTWAVQGGTTRVIGYNNSGATFRGNDFDSITGGWYINGFYYT